jgi:hypothetical protein
MSKEKNTITINGTDYTVKPGMKAIIIFEKITDEAFRLKTTTDILTYCYAAILAGTPDSKLGFDELLFEERLGYSLVCAFATLAPSSLATSPAFRACPGQVERYESRDQRQQLERCSLPWNKCATAP